jgi:DNA-binding NarL/FixJ family response regulator
MSLSISIIEDDDTIRQHLNEIIKSSAHCTLQGSAKNGAEARLIIKEDKTDIYLVDLGLPDVDGLDLIAIIKSSCHNAKVLVITTFGDDKHMSSSIRAGASGYLLKEDIGPDLNEKIIALSNGFSQISKSLVKSLFKEISAGSDKHYEKNKLNNLSDFSFAPRELEVLKALMTGAPIFNIAVDIGISTHTVNQHLRSIYKKFNVHSRAMAVNFAIKNGFTEQ